MFLVSVWHATMLPCFAADGHHHRTQRWCYNVSLFCWPLTTQTGFPGCQEQLVFHHLTGLNTVTNVVVLASKTPLAVVKLQLDFTQTSPPDGICDNIFFFCNFEPCLTSVSLCRLRKMAQMLTWTLSGKGNVL